LEADQHTVQSLKSVFLNRNLNQNMLKNAVFFGKAAKPPQRWGRKLSVPVLTSGG